MKKRVQNLEEVDIVFGRAFDEHCVIQTNRWTGFVFRTSVKDPANFKEGLPAPRESLKKKQVVPNGGKECQVITPGSKRYSLKSVGLAVQQHKSTWERWKMKYLRKMKSENIRERWKIKTPEKGEKWKHPRKVKLGNIRGRWNMETTEKGKNETPQKAEKWKTLRGSPEKENRSCYLLILTKLKI